MLGRCTVLSYSDTNTTCVCSIAHSPTSFRSQRHLKITDEEYNSIDFVSMVGFIATDSAQTWTSATDLTLISVQQSYQVLVTVGTLFISFLFMCLMAIYLDYKAGVDTDKQKGKVHASSSFANSTSASGKIRNDKLFERIGSSNSSQPLKLGEQEALLTYSLPDIYSSKPLTVRICEELKRHHKWLGLFYHYSESFPRMLRVLSLGCAITTMLFMQAVTYDVVYPDNGSCEQHRTAQACAVGRSPFNSAEPKCYWNDVSKGCEFIAANSTLTVIMYVAVISAIASTPISIFCDWLIVHVLNASAINHMRRHNGSISPALHNKRQHGSLINLTPAWRHINSMKHLLNRARSRTRTSSLESESDIDRVRSRTSSADDENNARNTNIERVREARRSGTSSVLSQS